MNFTSCVNYHKIGEEYILSSGRILHFHAGAAFVLSLQSDIGLFTKDGEKLKKKWMVTTVIMVILILIVAVTPISVPRFKHYNHKFEGILYQLGEKNKDFLAPIEVHFDGKLYTDILGKKTYEGIVYINDKDFHIPKERAKVELKFQKNNSVWSAVLFYHYFDPNDFHGSVYGELFIDDDFSKITITKPMEYSDGSGGGWGSDDGFMISAPATNREEALKITNELAGKAWNYDFE
ncbi:hypothetical protein [Paenibacillus marinisediminis]